MPASVPVQSLFDSVTSALLPQVRQLIGAARQRVVSTVNTELTQLYWHIGQRISTELLQGQRGEYGKQVVAELARQLTATFRHREARRAVAIQYRGLVLALLLDCFAMLAMTEGWAGGDEGRGWNWVSVPRY